MKNKKHETYRCSFCTYLIYSKKKVRSDRKIYHMTCYKRMIFERDYYEKEITTRTQDEQPKSIYGTADKTGQPISE